MLAALASALHIFFIAMMVAAFYMRCLHLHQEDIAKPERMKKVFFWDNLSLLVVSIAMAVGVWRMWLEKGPSYYLQNHMFWAKMGILAIGMVAEWPIMMRLIRWRIELRRGEKPDTSGLARLRKHEIFEAVGLPCVILAAALMARGYGQPPLVPPSEAGQEQATVLDAGSVLYSRHCQACHQHDGRGLEGRLAADFTGPDSPLSRSDDALLRSIDEGVPGTRMAAWGATLDGAEQRSVLAFIRSRFGEN